MRRLLPVAVLLTCVALLWAALPATDAFTAADFTRLTTYSASWTENTGGLFYIKSNSLYPLMDGSKGFVHWNADSFSADQYSSAVLVSVPSNTRYVGPAVRVAASDSTGYAVVAYHVWDYDHIVLKKVVGGTVTDIHDEAIATNSIQVNDVIYLQVVGTTLSVKRNGVAAFADHTDSDISSGSAGIYGLEDGDGARVDNWEGGNIASSAVRRQVRITQ